MLTRMLNHKIFHIYAHAHFSAGSTPLKGLAGFAGQYEGPLGIAYFRWQRAGMEATGRST